MDTYTTVQGDMWDSISKKIYGNEKYTGELMKANLSHISTLVFSSGIVLNIPTITQNTVDTSNLPPWRN